MKSARVAAVAGMVAVAVAVAVAMAAAVLAAAATATAANVVRVAGSAAPVAARLMPFLRVV